MKHLNYIFLFVFCLTAALSHKSEYLDSTDHLEICRNKTYEASSPPNYLGSSLISNFKNDSTDLILCPGDAFGDLNETYVVLQDCFLVMYHQGKQIWSFGGTKEKAVGLCAVALEKDGNLVLYKEHMTCLYPVESFPIIWPLWDSGTEYKPKMAELRIQDEQLQIVQIFKDRSERIFYTGQNIREFQEDLGAPRQVAEKVLIINHANKDDVILRRNEFIGDLNGMHLILQTNCELQLNNKNRTIWSFAAYLKPDNGCTLNTKERNSIGISKIPGSDYHYEGMKILPFSNFAVLQSKITFQGDRLLIIQTLKSGHEITFYTESGQDIGLKLKRDGKQIAQNKMTISSETILERMDYIGDLNGLHLILQDDCIFKLANGQQELWKLKESLEGPFMECSVQFNEDGTIIFNWDKNDNEKGGRFPIFGKDRYEKGDPPSKFQLSLKNNMMVLTLKYRENKKAINVHHAGVNTNGTWFQYLSGHSLIANAQKDKVFPEMGYIGDLNGVYAVLNKRGNWILFNKTLPIWESGTTQEYESGFVLILTKDGNVAVTQKWRTQKEDFLWSSQTADFYKEAELSQSELFVNNEGLWLNNIYTDGFVKRFKALEGTNSFIALPDDKDALIRSSF